MEITRKKTKQINFRLAEELGDRFEDYCRGRGISMTQFLENSIRQVLGEKLTIPYDALGASTNKLKVSPLASSKIKVSASDVDGLEKVVQAIVRAELESTLEKS